MTIALMNEALPVGDIAKYCLHMLHFIFNAIKKWGPKYWTPKRLLIVYVVVFVLKTTRLELIPHLLTTVDVHIKTTKCSYFAPTVGTKKHLQAL